MLHDVERMALLSDLYFFKLITYFFNSDHSVNGILVWHSVSQFTNFGRFTTTPKYKFFNEQFFAYILVKRVSSNEHVYSNIHKVFLISPWILQIQSFCIRLLQIIIPKLASSRAHSCTVGDIGGGEDLVEREECMKEKRG